MEDVTKIYEGLAYSTREVNMQFRIKLNQYAKIVYMDEIVEVDGKRKKVTKRIVLEKAISTTLGVAGLIRYVGDVNVVNNFIKRALEGGNDVEECKLRRGAMIRFYGK